MQNVEELEAAIVKIDFKKVGQRIQHKRKIKGLTQAELAASCGCTSNHLSAIENGTNKPSLEMIIKISILLDESTDYFLMDTPHAYPKYLVEAQIEERLHRCNTKMLQTFIGILDNLLELQDSFEEDKVKI